MAENKTRIWTIPDDVWSEPDNCWVTPPFDIDQAEREMVALATSLRRLGGILNVAADRVEVADGVYVTIRFVCRWQSFAPPAPRAKTPEPPPAEKEVDEALDEMHFPPDVPAEDLPSTEREKELEAAVIAALDAPDAPEEVHPQIAAELSMEDQEPWNGTPGEGEAVPVGANVVEGAPPKPQFPR